MEPADKIQDQEKKITNCELELNDLRQISRIICTCLQSGSLRL